MGKCTSAWFIHLIICDQVCKNQPYQCTKIATFAVTSFSYGNRMDFIPQMQIFVENFLKLTE